jgi:hypothetical protein
MTKTQTPEGGISQKQVSHTRKGWIALNIEDQSLLLTPQEAWRLYDELGAILHDPEYVLAAQPPLIPVAKSST